MKKLLYLYLIIPIILLGQTKPIPVGSGYDRAEIKRLKLKIEGNKSKSSDIEYYGIEKYVKEDMRVADTTTLKTLKYSDGRSVYLRKLSSSTSVGGGWFVVADSAYPEGGVAFNHPTAGKQWVRQEYLDKKVVNVKWFGAVGDGVADDTQAIQDALNVQDSSIVVIPEGIFKIDTVLEVSKPVTIKLVGTIKEVNGGKSDVFKIKSNNVTVLGGGTIIGQEPSDWDQDKVAIFRIDTTGVLNIKIENIIARNKQAFIRLRGEGQQAKGVNGLIVENCKATNIVVGVSLSLHTNCSNRNTNVTVQNSEFRCLQGALTGSRPIGIMNGVDINIIGNKLIGGGMAIELYNTPSFMSSLNDSLGYSKLSQKIMFNFCDVAISGGTDILFNTIDMDSIPPGRGPQADFFCMIESGFETRIIGNTLVNIQYGYGGILIGGAGAQIIGNNFENFAGGNYGCIYYSTPYTPSYDYLNGRRQNIIISNNYFENIDIAVRSIVTSGTTNARAIIISNNIVKRAYREAFRILYTDEVIIRNNYIEDAFYNQTTVGTYAVNVSNSNNVIVDGNIFKNTKPDSGFHRAMAVGSAGDTVFIANNKGFNLRDASSYTIQSAATKLIKRDNYFNGALFKDDEIYTSKARVDSISINDNNVWLKKIELYPTTADSMRFIITNPTTTTKDTSDWIGLH